MLTSLTLTLLRVLSFCHPSTPIPRAEVFVRVTRSFLKDFQISAFSFRAAEPDGLVFYHGALTDNSSEFIAFELLDGHLFMVIDLGAGPVRLQVYLYEGCLLLLTDNCEESYWRKRLAQRVYGKAEKNWKCCCRPTEDGLLHSWNVCQSGCR